MISGVVLVGFRCVYCCLCGFADWLVFATLLVWRVCCGFGGCSACVFGWVVLTCVCYRFGLLGLL